MTPVLMTLSDRLSRFQGHGVTVDAVDVFDVLRAQLTRDLFAIAKFLSSSTCAMLTDCRQ